MTDAEILRTIADHSYMGATAAGDAALIVLATDLPKGDIDEAIQRAATALDENARLRAALERIATMSHEGTALYRWARATNIAADALRKPDAAGCEHE